MKGCVPCPPPPAWLVARGQPSRNRNLSRNAKNQNASECHNPPQTQATRKQARTSFHRNQSATYTQPPPHARIEGTTAHTTRHYTTTLHYITLHYTQPLSTTPLCHTSCRKAKKTTDTYSHHRTSTEKHSAHKGLSTATTEADTTTPRLPH